MNAHRNDEELLEENRKIRVQLEEMKCDCTEFDALSPSVANLRMKSVLRYTERSLAKQPELTDAPSSRTRSRTQYWISGMENEISHPIPRLSDANLETRPEATLTDQEVTHELETLVAEIGRHGVGFVINELVPDRIAYRYLLSELEVGFAMEPGWYIYGCSGCCDGCFQLPYCDVGQECAAECGFDIPTP